MIETMLTWREEMQRHNVNLHMKLITPMNETTHLHREHLQERYNVPEADMRAHEQLIWKKTSREYEPTKRMDGIGPFTLNYLTKMSIFNDRLSEYLGDLYGRIRR